MIAEMVEIKSLGEVTTILNGGTPKTGVAEFWDGECHWITPADLGKLKGRYVDDTPRKITQLGLAKSSAKLVAPHSVILSTRAPIGHLAINTVAMATNQGCRGLVPNNDLSAEYLYYFLWLNRELLDSLGTGATFKELSTKALASVKIPIPPLPEQERIVAKLDAAFAAIDQAKANVERNLHNAKELFQSKLNEVFSQKGDGWVEKKLSEITTKIGSGATPRGGQSSYKTEGISLIRSLNVYDDGFREKDLAFIDDDQATKLDNVTLQENDVLLNITGASVARCCVVPKDYLPARVNQHVSIIRARQGTIEPDFLHYQLISKPCKDELLGIGEQGATRQAITKAQIENYTVRYPQDSNDQLKVVAELERFKEATKQLQTHYTQKLAELEELKKSLLERAFRGEI